MQTFSRYEDFPGGGPGELSVLSWNLLAPCHHESECCDNGGVRLQLSARKQMMWQWLLRFVRCDVLCFQEVDVEHCLDELREVLEPHGFDGIVQMRRNVQSVNATFFKRERFWPAWVDHRSRVLLVGLGLPDGRVLAVANVHLQSMMAKDWESQQKAQLAKAMRRAAAQKPWCMIVCGDFNHELQQGSQLGSLLDEYDLHKAPSSGHTCIVGANRGRLDHILHGSGLHPTATLGSHAENVRRIGGASLPDANHPSDHLPVAAVFALDAVEAAATAQALHVPRVPVELDEAVRIEWLAIMDAGTDSTSREQRKAETAFFARVGARAAPALKQWRSATASLAQLLVARAVSKALAR